MKKWIWFVFVALMLYGMSIPVYASINGGLETVEMSQDQYQTTLENIDVTLIKEASYSMVRYIAINELGQVAISLVNGKINIYDADGTFLYGCSPGLYWLYRVEWDNDMLIIIPMRGSLAIEVNSDAQIISIHDVLHTKDNSDYKNNVLSATEHTTTSGYHVEMHNRRLGPLALLAWGKVYSEVVVTDPQGNATVIYDVRARLVLWRAFVLASFIFLVWRGFKIDKARRAKAALTDKEKE